MEKLMEIKFLSESLIQKDRIKSNLIRTTKETEIIKQMTKITLIIANIQPVNTKRRVDFRGK